MQLALDFAEAPPAPELVTVTMGLSVARFDDAGHLTEGFLSQYRVPVTPFCGQTEGNGQYWSEPPETDRTVWHCGLHGFEDRKP